MKSDKELKIEFGRIVSKQPEKHYPVQVLQENGFVRSHCQKCGRFFWSVFADSRVCGDPVCSGGYRFVGNSPAKKQFDYVGAWRAFRDFFKKRGYLELGSYPVVARWRPDVFWVGASVYPFQPFVVSGEIKPKSNAVVIPQLCLRFNDIDNVGITGSHFVCFDMFGQLRFEEAKNYRVNDSWREYFEWLTVGMGVPKDELFVHEDVWAGGGNFGPCMEFFSRGLELGNQVYMQYRLLENGFDELKIKVLDMGQGHERIPWFCSGASNCYELVFPSVAGYLHEVTGIGLDEKFLRSFVPFSGLLNVDEVENVDKVWAGISRKLGIEKKELQERVLSLAALYSVGEHSRAALVALNDGALPSNVGGGYNLRVVLRRVFGFCEKFGWEIDFARVLEMHAFFLKPLFPFLSENLEDVRLVFENEKKKFEESRNRSQRVLNGMVLSRLSSEKLLELYDSHGISPESVVLWAKEQGKRVVVPENFYSLVSARHERQVPQTSTRKGFLLNVSGLPLTELLFFDDWKMTEFEAMVLRVINGEFVVLDRTSFYPTSGGQVFDTGKLGGFAVVDVFKQDGIVLHRVPGNDFKDGQKVGGIVDFERRKQLMQHHSGVHVLNLCARRVLGPHVFQAGASKTVLKARLDITHFDNLSGEQLKEIQDCCNEVVEKDLVVKKEILPREQAEEKYGMRIYQGGFIPGRNLRIVSIASDSEACGGTHANRTGEIGSINVLGSSKISDGVVRLTLVAGNALQNALQGDVVFLNETAKILGVQVELVPARIRELFFKWKKAKKGMKKGVLFEKDFFVLKSFDKLEGKTEKELLESACMELSVSPENLSKTVKRFLSEFESFSRQVKFK